MGMSGHGWEKLLEAVNSVYFLPAKHGKLENVPGPNLQCTERVQLKANRSRVRSRGRGMGERAEGPNLCHCGAKLLWSCSCQCCSLAAEGAWPPWYHTPGCQNKGVPAWEKLLHHILHMWERSSTDEQKSRRKSKTNRCGSH